MISRQGLASVTEEFVVEGNWLGRYAWVPQTHLGHAEDCVGPDTRTWGHRCTSRGNCR